MTWSRAREQLLNGPWREIVWSTDSKAVVFLVRTVFVSQAAWMTWNLMWCSYSPEDDSYSFWWPSGLCSRPTTRPKYLLCTIQNPHAYMLPRGWTRHFGNPMNFPLELPTQYEWEMIQVIPKNTKWVACPRLPKWQMTEFYDLPTLWGFGLVRTTQG